jgi:hypothetical protein
MRFFNGEFFGKMTSGQEKRRSFSSRRLLNPVREWLTSLFVALLVASGLFAYAGWEFYRQFTDAGIPEVSEEHIPRYRALDAELLIRYYEGKEIVWNELNSNSTLPVSPEEGQAGASPLDTEDADESEETGIPQEMPKME